MGISSLSPATPPLTSTARCVAYRANATGQTIPINTLTTIIMDTVVTDPLSGYSTSTGLWTVPSNAAGVYDIQGTIGVSTQTSSAQFFSIVKNGSEARRGYQIPSASGLSITIASVAAKLILAAGDRVGIAYLSQGIANTTLGGSGGIYTTLEISYIGAT